jgi:hypothetical protein
MMAWYGVNLMGAGSLHSYGVTADTVQIYLTAFLLAAQWLYALAALSVSSPAFESVAPSSRGAGETVGQLPHAVGKHAQAEALSR